jgi:hypothetical protein
MAELKTKKNEASVDDFLAKIQNDEKQKDARQIARIMQRITGERPKMWGPSIVGFGQFHYRYDSGREADWLVTGFSPRAQNLTLYLMAGFAKLGDKLKKLGKHSTSKSCLNVKRLADVDSKVLESIIAQGVVETLAMATNAAPSRKPNASPAAKAPTSSTPGKTARAATARRGKGAAATTKKSSASKTRTVEKRRLR